MDKARFNNIIELHLEQTPKANSQKGQRDYRLAIKPRACEDCLRPVKDRQVWIIRKGIGTNREAWRAKCSKCRFIPLIRVPKITCDK